MPQASSPTDVTAEKLREVLAAGKRVLIVGAPPGTFSDRMERHSSLLFWPSTEKSSRDHARVVPAEVGAVLMTALLSHALSHNVRDQATARRLMFTPQPLSPGAIKRLLSAAMTPPDEENAEEPTLLTAATPSRTASQADVVQFIDDTIAGLQLLRETVQQMSVAQSSELQALRAKADRFDRLTDLLKQ